MGTNNRVLYTPRVDTNARIFDNLLDQLIDNLFHIGIECTTIIVNSLSPPNI
jgi:hypothetical protein